MMDNFSLLGNYPVFALPALRTSGATIIDRLGMDVVRDVIFDVLTGRNIRDSTEILTRRRITTVNLGIVSLFLSALRQESDYRQTLIQAAKSVLTCKESTRGDMDLARWIVGLTNKSIQNVLRDDSEALDGYINAYVTATEDVAKQFQAIQGELLSAIPGITSSADTIDWNWIAHLTNTVGTSTLTIRGSDKSTFGKLFEKFILGSLLEILGFRFQPEGEGNVSPGQFVLSSRGSRRESDATLLLGLGDAIRFDIGFIGRGNPEISLDKVTRFESEASIGGGKRYVTTIIVVDRIGDGSRLPELVRNIGGHIVQMSGSYWPRTVARLIGDLTQDHDELSTCSDADIQNMLRQRFDDVDLGQFV